ncbi:MAG TPA: response regulator transcription factor [Anaerolineae bacterium]
MTEPLRIILADDHVLFRRGLAGLIAGQPGLTIVGEAGDGEEAAALVRERAPDAVLIDIHMPHCTGLEAIPLIKAARPEVKIVMLTVSCDDRDLFSAIKLGADGYLTKDLEPQQLFDMLLGLARGEAPIAPALAARILEEFRQMQRSPARPLDYGDELTARENDVLKLVALGATNREIAAALSISENTVKIHLRNILEKLHLQNRTQATAYAIQHKIVEGPHPEH